MRNLILFFQKFYLFFLFIGLQTVSFYLLAKNNNFQNTAVVNASNYMVGQFYESVSWFTDYLKLRDVNDQLLQENAKYRSGIIQSFYNGNIGETTKIDSGLKQQFSYIPARLINSTTNLRNNFLILNRGTKHGIAKNMAVITSAGIVGIVMEASENFCSVQSFLNKNAQISVKIKENGYFGPLVWDGANPQYGTLTDINKHVNVKVGQDIITSGFSSIFPEGINVGKVEEVDYDAGGNFYKLKIKLATDFGNLSAVYIVNSLMKKEVEQLEINAEAQEKKAVNTNVPKPH